MPRLGDVMSFPEPTAIYSADICRDGGTLVLGYFDCGGAQHEVELPVRKDDAYEVVGYWPPTVKSHATGAVSSLDWDDASRLGERLAPLIGEAIECCDRARQIVYALSLRGRLPSAA